MRDPLYNMKNARNQYELEDAINDFIKLVPNEFHRKFYLRIYKWTIAFASWKKPHEELEGIIRTLYPNQQRQQQEGGDSSLAVFNNPLFRGTNTSSPGRGSPTNKLAQLSLSGKHIAFSTNSGYENGSSPRKDLNSSLSPVKSPAGGGRRFSFTQSLGKKYDAEKDIAVLDKRKKQLQQMGGYAAGPSSPMQQYASTSPVKSSPLKTSTMSTMQSPGATTAIPFSQRQSKSIVAAREMLKKGKPSEVVTQHMTKTDKLIYETMKEYKQFQKNVPKKSTWSG